MFVDASYEGDLAIASGTSFTYGRESNATYGEPLAGVQPFNPFENFLIVRPLPAPCTLHLFFVNKYNGELF